MEAALAAVMHHHLKHDVVARLKAFPHGVGIVAFRPIAKGAFPFKTTAGLCYAETSVWISRKAVQKLDNNLRQFADDFFLGSKDGFPIPSIGPNGMDISFYLNHSDTPNLEIVYHETCNYTVYQAIRDIEVGEELTIDYCKFSSFDEDLQKRLDPANVYLKCRSESKRQKQASR
jgi:SET domain-containing protein